MAKVVEFDGLHCGNNEEFDKYLKKSYLECFSILENVCEEINKRYWVIYNYFKDAAKEETAGGNDIFEYAYEEISRYLRVVSKGARDIYIFGDEEYIEKGCQNWVDVLFKQTEEMEDTEAIGIGLTEFKDKYLNALDFKSRLDRLPGYFYECDGGAICPNRLEELISFCRYYVVDGFNKALKHIRVNVDRLLSGKEVRFEDYQVAFDFAGTKSKIVNGANNIFQSLFSKRKVFINEDLYKKIEDDVIKKHKKADDIVNEIISNYYNGINVENPATAEEQPASDVEDDMAQIDAMLKSMNGEEVEAPVAEPTVEEIPDDELEVDQAVEEKSQVSQEVVETLNSAKSSLADSLDEEFRKLQESLGLA